MELGRRKEGPCRSSCFAGDGGGELKGEGDEARG
jgi:hypothetical protein